MNFADVGDVGLTLWPSSFFFMTRKLKIIFIKKYFFHKKGNCPLVFNNLTFSMYLC